MSIAEELNTELQGIALKMSEIEEKAKKTDEDIQSYKSLVERGKKLRTDLDVALQGEDFKAWAKSPRSGVQSKSYPLTQELTSPEDRDQEQKAQDIKHKSEYKSVFEAYMRYGVSGLSIQDRKILREGAVNATDARATKAVSEGVETAGGFTVPDDFQAEVLKKEPGLIGLYDSVRHQQTSRDVLVWPRIVYTTDNKKTSGIGLTWTGEVPAAATTADVTDESFGQVRIPVYVAMAGQKLSNSLVEDSAVNIMELTAELFRENIMQDLEAVIATGTGLGRPEGILVKCSHRSTTSLFCVTTASL